MNYLLTDKLDFKFFLGELMVTQEDLKNKIKKLIMDNKILLITSVLLVISILFYLPNLVNNEESEPLSIEVTEQEIQSTENVKDPETDKDITQELKEKKIISEKKKSDQITNPIPKNKPLPPKKLKTKKDTIYNVSSPTETLMLLHSTLQKISKSKITYQEAENIISQTYDAEKMLELIVGETFKKTENKTKVILKKVFEEFITKNYIRRFNSIESLEFGEFKVNEISKIFKMVETKLIINNEKFPLTYLLNKKKKSWRVFDVLIDNSISEIATKKSEFRNFINKGRVEPLIEALRKKNSKLLNN